MAIYAFKSSIVKDFPRATYRYLVGLSGAAFKFVYDSLESYEPLRDACPVDILTRASMALGFHEAHWELDQPIEVVKDLIKCEIDSGRPVIAPYLKPDAYHGFCVITGYDYEQNVFYLQGAFSQQGKELAIPVPDGWDGPTASPAGWATNPIFIIGPKTGEHMSSDEIAMSTFTDGVRLMKGGELVYGGHPGEAEYMGKAGPRQALYGLPAFDLLSLDIENEALVKDEGGAPAVNFGLIWRIDAQLGQLEHDRDAAADLLKFLTNSVPAEKSMEVKEAIRDFEQVKEHARGLRSIFWCVVPPDVGGSAAISKYITDSPSMVFRITVDEGVRSDLKANGYGVFKTPWGWVAIHDTHQKRMLAKTALRQIIVRERHQIDRLTGIMEHVGKRELPKRSRKQKEADDKR
jgi:hypothetical protein